MSIYHARRKQPGGAKQPDPKLTAADALEFSAPPSDPAPPKNMAWLRRARPVEYMLPATVKWFEALPHEVRPVALAEQYARVANLLAQQWNDDKACRAYFDDLLAGRRGKRRGFPVNVRRELWLLREYYQRTRLTTDGQLAIV
jgi:hypothetical protein